MTYNKKAFRRPEGSPSAASVLRIGADIYEERNKMYGDNFATMGKVFAEFFPNGVELKTEEDFRRFHLFNYIIGKMGRYAQTFEIGGHLDSLDDTVVYAAMLANEDRIIASQKKVK